MNWKVIIATSTLIAMGWAMPVGASADDDDYQRHRRHKKEYRQAPNRQHDDYRGHRGHGKHRGHSKHYHKDHKHHRDYQYHNDWSPRGRYDYGYHPRPRRGATVNIQVPLPPLPPRPHFR